MKGKQVAGLIVLGLCVLGVLAVLLFVIAQEKQASSHSEVQRVSLAEIRASLFSYLNESAYHEEAYLETLQTRPLTEIAWALLGLAREMESHDGGTETQKKALARLHAAWIGKANGGTELYSVHQLFSAGMLLGSEDILYWVRDRHSYLKWYATTNLLPEKSHGKINSYLLATASRQLSQGLRLPSYIEVMDDQPAKVDDIDAFQEVLEISHALIQIAREDQKSGMDSSYPPLFKNGSLPQTSCWIAWAELALLQAEAYLPPESARYSRDVKSSLSDFFEILDTNLITESPSFRALQTAVPCLQTLAELPQLKSLLSDRKLDQIAITDDRLQRVFVHLMERTVLPLWDSEDTQLCEADGGFFSQSVEDKNLICEQKKILNDNSWLAFALRPEWEGLSFKLLQ